nr:hypothetical protein [Tanacetum cinerariifolium]
MILIRILSIALPTLTTLHTPHTGLTRFPVIHPPPQETSIKILHDQENVINYVQTFLRKFNRYSFFKTPKVLLLAWDRVFEIKDALGNKQYKPEDIQELFRKLFNDVQNIHEELAEYINTLGWNRLAFYNNGDDDDVDYTIAITPVLSTEDPDNSLSMRDEHLDTIPATESDEVIKSGVEDLILIPSESEGIPDTMCDVHLVKNPTPLEAKDHFEIVINSNDDISSSDDDSLYNENIEYVEASPHDSELVSLEVAEIVILEDKEIEDDNLREKLLNSSSTSPKSFLEETNTFDNSFLEFENFCFDLEEISSGSTTTYFDISLPDYEAFYFYNDHIEEISSGSTTTHSDISLSEYDSFIFDLSNDQFPPTDRGHFAHEEFADELAHIISPPEYDCFYFRNFLDLGEWISIINSRIHKNLSSTTRVNLQVEDDHSPLLAYVVWIFLSYLTYPIIPPYLHSFRNQDTIFDPGIAINRFYSFKPGALGDKIICDLDKTPDFSQQYPQNCPKCGNPVKGHYCQGCAVLQQTFKEDLFASAIKHGIIQDSFEPCNDNSNVVNAPREPFIVNQDPGKNFSQSPPHINHHCCYECGDPLEGIFCRQCICKLCRNGTHYGYNCPPKVLIIPDPKPFHNQTIKELPPTMQSFDPKNDLVHKSPNVSNPPSQLPFISCEFYWNDARYGHYCTPQVPFVYPEQCYNQDFNVPQEFQGFHDFQQQDLCCENGEVEEKKIKEAQAANARNWKIPTCYDDDDDYNFAIAPNKPVNSLSIGDEHPDTVPATKSDEFIKSSVENLVPIPSESEDESECDVPDCEEFTTFSNVLFEADYKFDSKSSRIHDSSLTISSKIDSLLDEFAGELTLLKSIPSGINEIDCDFKEDIRLIKKLLYDNSSPRPLEEFVSVNSDAEIESFSPSPIPVEDIDSFIKEIDLSFNLDYPMLSGIEDDGYDSKRDILVLKDLPSNDTLSIPEIESFHFDIPSFSRPPAKPPYGMEEFGLANRPKKISSWKATHAY